MNQEIARHNMIEQQIRPWNVLDSHVLDALSKVNRELFVGNAYSDVAYADAEIPLENGGTITSPKLAARICESMHFKPTDKVLEIGTGSGYLTAVIAQLASHVFSVEIDEAQMEIAKSNLHTANIHNVSLFQGDGLRGLTSAAPFDAIVFSGATKTVDENLLKQLVNNNQGRMFAIIGESPAMEAVIVYRNGFTGMSQESLFELDVPYLNGQEMKQEFSF